MVENKTKTKRKKNKQHFLSLFFYSNEDKLAQFLEKEHCNIDEGNNIFIVLDTVLLLLAFVIVELHFSQSQQLW